jgi:NAD(P)H-dependent FMN reductase
MLYKFKRFQEDMCMIHASSAKPTVFVIAGSVRAGRRCLEIASWVTGIAAEASNLNCELVDLAEWPLPMTDEPYIPQQGEYTQPHTQAWSRKIAAADAFIFVTPQYNWGYPAPLKNAIDHLYKEWEGKPAVIVSYGGHGGDKCAAQLRQVLEAVHLKTVATMPAITLTRAMIFGGACDLEKDFAAEADVVRKAIRELSDELERKAT